MKARPVSQNLPPVVYFLMTFMFIFAIDTLYQGGFYTTALAGFTRFNELWRIIWFSEVFALILFPVLLLTILRKRYRGSQKVVWYVLGITSLCIAFFFLGAAHNDYYFIDGAGIVLKDFNPYEALHSALYYHTFDSYDFQLQSIFPRFLLFQLPFVVVSISTVLFRQIASRNKLLDNS